MIIKMEDDSIMDSTTMSGTTDIEYENLPTLSNQRQRTVDELKECQNYWLRKAKLLVLEERGIKFSPLQMAMIRFEVALHFDEMADAIEVVDKIFPSNDTSLDSEIRVLLGIFLDKLLKGNIIVARKINEETLINICAEIYQNAMNNDVGLIFLITKMAFLNPITLQITATDFWKKFLTITSSSEKQYFMSRYDLLLLRIAPALIETQLSNLSQEIALDIYHRLLLCTLMHSLRKVPKDYYDLTKIENYDVAGAIPPIPREDVCWRNCAGFIASIYLKFMTHSGEASRKNVASILVESIFDLEEKFDVENFPKDKIILILPTVSFIGLTQRLLKENGNKAVFDAVQDLELVRLLVFYAFSSIPKNNADELTENENAKMSEICNKESIFVFAPRYFCDLSHESIVDFWQNEEFDERLYDEENNEDEEIILEDDEGSNSESYKILFSLEKGLKISQNISTLFDQLLGPNSLKLHKLYVSSTILQAHMFFADYNNALNSFVEFENQAVDDKERRIFKLQYLQICMALQRHATMRRLRARNPVQASFFKIDAEIFNKCLAIILDIINNLKQSSTNRNCSMLFEIFDVKEENCYAEICTHNIDIYSVLCLLQILFCEMRASLPANYDRKSYVNFSDHLVSKIDFFNSFSLCTLQLLIDNPIAHLILENFFKNIHAWERFSHQNMINYLSSLTLLNYIFGISDKIKLQITEGVESGKELARGFLNGMFSISKLSHVENYEKFVADNHLQIDKLFPKSIN